MIQPKVGNYSLNSKNPYKIKVIQYQDSLGVFHKGELFLKLINSYPIARTLIRRNSALFL